MEVPSGWLEVSRGMWRVGTIGVEAERRVTDVSWLLRRDVLLLLLLDGGLVLDDLCRCDRLCRGLRWIEMGRLSGCRDEDRGRWDLDGRCGDGGGIEGGKTGAEGGWLEVGGCVGICG